MTATGQTATLTAGQQRPWFRRIAVWVALILASLPLPFFIYTYTSGDLSTWQWISSAIHALNLVVCIVLTARRARGDVLILSAGIVHNFAVALNVGFGGGHYGNAAFNFTIGVLVSWAVARWLKTT